MRRTIFIFALLGLIGSVTAYFFLCPRLEATTPEAQTASSTTTPQVITPTPDMIGQLFMIGHWAHTPVASTTALIKTHRPGGVIIMSAPGNEAAIADWVTTWQAASDIPLFIAIDQEGGPVSRLRGPSFTTTSQRELAGTSTAYEVGFARGSELSALGINLNFAPVLDRATQADSFMYERAFPAYTNTAALAGALIAGQRAAGVLSVAKHFPGHADTSDDSHEVLPTVPLTLDELPMFTAAFSELFSTNPPAAIMTAHVSYPNIDAQPATLSPFFLTEYARTTLGFEGLIITDDMIMQAITKTWSSDEASLAALLAGADMLLFAAEPEEVADAIAVVTAASTATSTTIRISESYARIMAVKATLPD